MGDPIRALQAREMIKIIKRDGLVANTAEVGAYVYQGLIKLQEGAGKGKISRTRGKGYVHCL
jgi:4-aminobutyrate aminotransferase/(S)-3-amino-2-methylpropionate transaminase